MRLIDVDKLLETLQDLEPHCDNKQYENGVLKMLRYYMPQIINDEPTAYSVDKVVEELEERKALHERLVDYETKNGTVTEKYQHIKAIDVLNDAIEIVKQGSVSDDVCEWKYNNSEYYWESSCEHLHIFMSDGPEENEYKFCPYCGKKIKGMESD